MCPKTSLSEKRDLFTTLQSRSRTVNPRFKRRDEALAEWLGLPSEALKPDRPARGSRLSDCIPEFVAEQRQLGSQKCHTNAYVNRFQAFVEFAKDTGSS